eukprot:609058-Amphidinium_carterae.1
MNECSLVAYGRVLLNLIKVCLQHFKASPPNKASGSPEVDYFLGMFTLTSSYVVLELWGGAGTTLGPEEKASEFIGSSSPSLGQKEHLVFGSLFPPGESKQRSRTQRGMYPRLESQNDQTKTEIIKNMKS